MNREAEIRADERETWYIVIGTRGSIDEWRRIRGLPKRVVIAACDPNSLRGFSGPCEVLTLDTANRLPAKTLEAIERDIAVLRALGHIQTGDNR